jgi:hypothetical protein
MSRVTDEFSRPVSYKSMNTPTMRKDSPMGTPSAQPTSETRTERERLASLLGDLTPEQWGMPSLCDGWQVREVVAHTTMPFRTKPIRVMAGVARAPWQPPGGAAAGALSHDVIHGLDVTEPLGLAPAPADRVALVLASTSPRQMKYFGVDLDGRKLAAIDTDVSVGEGSTVVTMTAKEILLVVTGRRPLNEVPWASR